MNYPKIVIVTPNYNKAEYLEETITSVLSQGYPNLDYYVIDGGSTDGSVDIIKRYSDKLKYWGSKPDRGMYDAIRKGFDMASQSDEDFVMGWINSDDMLHPRSLYTIAEIFSSFPQINWLTGAATHYDEQGRTIWVSPARYFSRDMFLMGDYKYVQQESTFWRNSLYNHSGGVRTDLKLCGDFELWLRFLRTEKMYITDALIGGFRAQTEGQLSSDIHKYLDEAEQVRLQEPVSADEKRRIKLRTIKLHIAGLFTRLHLAGILNVKNILFRKEMAEAGRHRLRFDSKQQCFVLPD